MNSTKHNEFNSSSPRISHDDKPTLTKLPNDNLINISRTNEDGIQARATSVTALHSEASSHHLLVTALITVITVLD